jgi:hypothetical protein
LATSTGERRLRRQLSTERKHCAALPPRDAMAASATRLAASRALLRGCTAARARSSAPVAAPLRTVVAAHSALAARSAACLAGAAPARRLAVTCVPLVVDGTASRAAADWHASPLQRRTRSSPPPQHGRLRLRRHQEGRRRRGCVAPRGQPLSERAFRCSSVTRVSAINGVTRLGSC